MVKLFKLKLLSKKSKCFSRLHLMIMTPWMCIMVKGDEHSCFIQVGTWEKRRHRICLTTKRTDVPSA